MKEMQKAAFLHGLNNIVVKKIPIPQPKNDEVLVRIEYVGICGSDVHYYHSGVCGPFRLDPKEDFILGHECAGTVVETGPRVKHLKIGDRVALEPGIACGQCTFCKSGKYNLCPDVRFLATPPIQGCYEEYLAFPENMCFKLPDNVSTKEGALIEPLAVGFHAAAQGEVGVGDTVAILGSGCIGLVTLLACKARGASKVIVTDLLNTRLDKACELGADYVVNGKEIDVLDRILELTDGKGADKVFETAGSATTISQTAHLVARGGRIVLVGLANVDEIKYNFAQIMDKEATIKSVFRYRNMYPTIIEALASESIDVEGIVTHEYELDQIQRAFEEVVNNKKDLVKTVIKVWPNSCEQ